MSNNNEGTKPAWMPNTVYDFLKWAALIAIPAFGTFYSIMAGVWNLPYANEVGATCLAVATLLGALIGVATRNYNKSDSKFDGTLCFFIALFDLFGDGGKGKQVVIVVLHFVS